MSKLKEKHIGEQFQSLIPVKGFPKTNREGDDWKLEMAWHIRSELASAGAPANKEKVSVNVPAPYDTDVLYKDLVAANVTIDVVTPSISQVAVSYVPEESITGDFSNVSDEEWVTNATYKEVWADPEDLEWDSEDEFEKAARVKAARQKGLGTIPSAELQMTHTQQNVSGAFDVDNMTDGLGEDDDNPDGVSGTPEEGFTWKKTNRSLRKVKGGERVESDTYQYYNKKV